MLCRLIFRHNLKAGQNSQEKSGLTIELLSARSCARWGQCKQEMLSEDLCALATLKTGRPVMWEFTRAELRRQGLRREPAQPLGAPRAKHSCLESANKVF